MRAFGPQLNASVRPMQIKKGKSVLQKLFVYMMLISVTTCYSACSNAITLFTATHQDWNFIQNVGGIEVGELQAIPNGAYFLPMNVDVSGITVKNKPEIVNSGLSIQSIHADVKGNDILIWVQSCLVSGAYQSSISKGITIGKLIKGKYRVLYLNNDGSTQHIRMVTAI
jgi:hypothetical protein